MLEPNCPVTWNLLQLWIGDEKILEHFVPTETGGHVQLYHIIYNKYIFVVSLMDRMSIPV